MIIRVAFKKFIRKKSLLFLFGLYIGTFQSNQVLAQQTVSDFDVEKEFSKSSFFWLGTYTKYRIGEKLWYNGEYHLRTRSNYVNEMAQLYIRLGLSYLVNKNFEITGGIVTPFYWVEEDLYEPTDQIDQIVPQFRFWQQFLFIQPLGRVKVYHQIRTEQRWRRDFIEESPFLLTHRFRYKFMTYVPINTSDFQEGTFYGVFYNEIFIQVGKSIKYNYLEDNRTFGGLGYILNENIQLQVGFMKTYQQRQNGLDFNNRDILRFSIYHNLDFYYKKNKLKAGNINPVFN